MSSPFELAFAEAGAPALLSQFGQSVTYTPAGGAGVGLTAIVHAEHEHEAEYGDGRRLIRTREMTIGRTPGGPYGGVEDVKLLDAVTYNGVAYAVSEILRQTQSLTTFIAVRREDMQRSREDYRRRHPRNRG